MSEAEPRTTRKRLSQSDVDRMERRAAERAEARKLIDEQGIIGIGPNITQADARAIFSKWGRTGKETHDQADR